jgi:hypothetical protein
MPVGGGVGGGEVTRIEEEGEGDSVRGEGDGEEGGVARRWLGNFPRAGIDCEVRGRYIDCLRKDER